MTNYVPMPSTPQTDAKQLWDSCVVRLQSTIPEQQFNTWIKPLTIDTTDAGLSLLAPNRFIRDWVCEKYLHEITRQLALLEGGQKDVKVGVIAAQDSGQGAFVPESKVPAGSSVSAAPRNLTAVNPAKPTAPVTAQIGQPGAADAYTTTDSDAVGSYYRHQLSGEAVTNREADSGDHRVHNAFRQHPEDSYKRRVAETDTAGHQHNLIGSYRFENFVEGKSNQLARAAATQVVQNPGGSYNPLFLYGGVGLGKTHLMHAVGNELKNLKPNAKVVYLHSERFVADMVKALQLNAINDFKRFYRSVDALLIDDIQFFANKERSQEEFFHTFNALLEGGQQMILTCDRYPKEINGVEERLKSRFGWGLTVAIEPPELETRVAILMRKAEQAKMTMPHDAAFFLAQRVRSNVRELEGALKRVIASAHFMDSPITVDLIKESLKDLLALQDKQISLDNIQRTTSEYYNIKVADLMSKRRNRSVARPRQVAMALAKELTNHSLPEIGDAFGGRDHTTVLHACRKIKELRDTSSDIREDYQNLLRTLAT